MFTTRPEITGSFGVVATTHWLASQSGMAMLEKDGNAFDAAAAAAFVLHVVEPHMNGLGGDVPIIVYDQAAKKVRIVCGQGTVPAGATIAHYRNLGFDLAPGTGLLATVIPGAFDAWLLMLREHGSLPLAEILAPAIHYAGTGYPLIPAVHDMIVGLADMFRDEWTSSADVYLKNGNVPKPGSMLRNEKLAETYARIRKSVV